MRYLLFVADDVAIISVPTHNLVLHSNDDIVYRQRIIIVGTIYYIHDNTNVVDTLKYCRMKAESWRIDHFPI
jgi:hypothetical protein